MGHSEVEHGEVSATQSRLRYQPALDGVRGVAVLAVMAFHGGVSWIPGGYLGVDLFFVLSGFLITTLLLREWAGTGGLALGAFWGRRARRLFPALILLLVGVSVYARFVADPSSLASLRWDGIASVLYVANWRFIFAHQSYFSSFSAPSPLRHVWSLAVEEQWYLLWPPLLAVVLRRFRGRLRTVLWVIGVLTVASVAAMAVLSSGGASTTRAYYSTAARAQTLLIGAGLAVLLHARPVVSRRLRAALQHLGLAGAAVVGLMMWRVPGTTHWMYDGGFALFALAGAAVVAAVMMPRSGWLKRVLRVRPLVWVGKISYGLYLWHWPVNLWLTPERVHVGSWTLLALRTAVAFVITVASYRLIEVPIRTRRWNLARPKLVTVNAAVGICAVLVVATVPRPIDAGARIALGSRAPGSHVVLHTTGSADSAKATASGSAARTSAGFAASSRAAAPAPTTTLAPGRPLTVMVAGDSVGWTLSWQQKPVDGVAIADGAIIGCGVLFAQPIINGQPIDAIPECKDQQQVWARDLAASEPNVVLLVYGAWEVYDQLYEGRRYRVGHADYRALLEKTLQSDIDFFASHTRAPIVLLDVPCYQEEALNLGGPTSRRNDPSRVAWVNSIFDDVVRRNASRVTEVPISRFLCPGGRFRSSLDGVTLRPDGVHFTIDSAQLTWQWLAPRLIAIAQGTPPAGGPR